ncbi:unnamed protein product [Symbiodinium natans]|uniref:Uncharacterized protein n=1 Tax=Symbiodinium natans TaxID=878477 RepID=A0A812LAU2_9DINO|nr:unnamed protein product [Symbiodinium natans]
MSRPILLSLVALIATAAGATGGCQQCDRYREEDCSLDGDCFSAGSARYCLESGGEYCIPGCFDCLAQAEECFHKNWALPCYSPGSEAACKQLNSEWCVASASPSASAPSTASSAPSTGDSTAETGVILQWILVTLAVAAITTACCIIGCLKRESSWTFVVPIDGPTERTLQRLESRLNSGKQGACSACYSQTAQQQRDRLLAKAAMQAAGGPEFWSLTVAHVSHFLADHEDALVKYCDKHAFTMDQGRPKHLCFDEDCSMEHGDMPHSFCDGQAASPLNTNMHVVVSRLIKPLTKDGAAKKGRDAKGTLGMWAFLTEGRVQRARTFVSHCWNEKFQDFVDTLQSLGPKEDVWICSFALPQNINIGEVLGNKPSKSPFARALAQAEQVLLAVDAKIEPPTRSWCCFELYLACMQQKTIRIEVPTQETQADIRKLKKKVKDAMEVVDISQCSASNQGDHEKIMAEIGFAVGDVNSKLAEKAAVEYLSACRLLDARVSSSGSSRPESESPV